MRVVVAVIVVAVAGLVAGLAWPSAGPRAPKDRGLTPAGVRPQQLAHRHVRLPQFVVVSFDGSGGGDMFEYWRAVARRVNAHFTFFVSGVYLIDWDQSSRYHPPRHARGHSDIGFAPDAQFAAATREQAARRSSPRSADAARSGRRSSSPPGPRMRRPAASSPRRARDGRAP
jgi:hypothetical protein